MASFKTLLFAHHTGDDPITRAAVNQFAERVARRSGGLLTIAEMPGGALGNLPALLRMVIAGQADMALAPHDRLSALLPKFGCIGLPFVFDDIEHADRVINGPFLDWAMPDLLSHGLHSLANWEWGFRQITNARHPIRHPGELRGLKIRVPPIPQIQEAMLALGAMPVVVEYGRLLDALRQGLVDAQENPVAVIHALKLHEHQQHLSMLDYNYGGVMHIINRASFDALSAEHQRIISEESTLAGAVMRSALRSRQASQLAELAALAGYSMCMPSAPFRALMPPALGRLAGHFGEKRVATFLDMVDHLRSPTEPRP
jgi:tripartite ATP-independent transporter DctP family solute receptor